MDDLQARLSGEVLGFRHAQHPRTAMEDAPLKDDTRHGIERVVFEEGNPPGVAEERRAGFERFPAPIDLDVVKHISSQDEIERAFRDALEVRLEMRLDTFTRSLEAFDRRIES